MQGTEHDIAFFLALGCAIALHCIALHCIALYCSVLYCRPRNLTICSEDGAGWHGERPRTPYARNNFGFDFARISVVILMTSKEGAKRPSTKKGVHFHGDEFKCMFD